MVAGIFSVRSCIKGKHNKQVCWPARSTPTVTEQIAINLVLPAGPYWSNILTVKSNLIVSVMAQCTKTCITHKILNYGPKLWKHIHMLAIFSEIQ